MTSSFKDIDSDIPAETAITPTVPANTEVVPDSFFSNEGLEGGDIGQIQIPWILLVHGVGDLSEKFQPGTLCLNGDNALKTPMNITVVRQKMYLLEHIPFAQRDEETRPKRFASMAEARGAGYIPRWESYGLNDPTIKTVDNCADMDILVEGDPADESFPFPLEHDGKPFLFARIRAKGKDFKLAAEKVKSVAAFNRDKPLSLFKWELKTVRLKEGTNWVWRLSLTPKGKNSDEFVQFARQLL